MQARLAGSSKKKPVLSDGPSLSRNLYVGVGLLDDPQGNVTNLPEVRKNAAFYRRDVEDAVPYNYECGLLRQSEPVLSDGPSGFIEGVSAERNSGSFR